MTRNKHAVLPRAHIDLPIGEYVNGDFVAVTPTFQRVNPLCWPAQICPIINGTARHTNWGGDIITCPKYAHFSLNTALEQGRQQEKGSKQQ